MLNISNYQRFKSKLQLSINLHQSKWPSSNKSTNKNAKRIARLVYKKDSKDIFINYLYAVAHFNDGKYRDAIDKFEYVLLQKDDYLDAKIGYINCLIELNKPKKAIDIIFKESKSL